MSKPVVTPSTGPISELHRLRVASRLTSFGVAGRSGKSLGSEQALQQRYRVSRSVLREAVRLVEHHQVARMRRGPNGGLLVCEPDAAPATHAIIIYLEYLGTTTGELLDARLLLEPLAASLAARTDR